MSSFFEKLKNGMGIEEPIEETVEKEPVKEKPAKQRKPRIKKMKEEEKKPETVEVEEPIAQTEKQIKITETICVEKTEEIKEPEEEKPEPVIEKPKEKKWFGQEGQLAIDVFQTEKELIIQSAIAGIKSEDLDISIEKDVISIRGVRENQSAEKGDYFIQECFWGPFSREIIVPVEIDPNSAEASMKDGVLTIRLPKIVREKKKKIVIRE